MCRVGRAKSLALKVETKMAKTPDFYCCRQRLGFEGGREYYSKTLITNARPEYASNVSGLSGVIVSEIVDGKNCSCDSLKCLKIDTSLHGRATE